MLKIEFNGAPFLFVGESLDESGAITTLENFKAGLASFAHYYPRGASDGVIKRYAEIIGARHDITVIGPAGKIEMTLGDIFVALDNMLGGDPDWHRGN